MAADRSSCSADTSSARTSSTVAFATAGAPGSAAIRSGSRHRPRRCCRTRSYSGLARSWSEARTTGSTGTPSRSMSMTMAWEEPTPDQP
ncbi:hypothetical protein HD597_008641 [Nonomuraea thailandensis]|uniref:Uncharacterized protein n=1 Tax=Nonomuraea thailandensis TaxID=1188745 RepID=A0A9X2GTR5_9ACTN|nr:hypothetical protein [Nonomuraea thailandensis]MCP2361621.1 hypothetical protein [Nonomuraea thailandensis]